MEVTKDHFVRQIDWMQEHGEVVHLDTALARRGEANSDCLFVLTFDDGYRDVYEQAFPTMKARGLPFTLYLATESIETGIPLTPGGMANPLTWGQIGEMVETGLVTIGAHTHRHADLRNLRVTEIERELETSDGLINDRLGVQPSSFAYPWGYWGERADPIVRRRYSSAVLGPGKQATASRDAHLVNRIPIQLSDGVFYFVQKLKRGMWLEDRVRRSLRGYHGP
jgi:peptidoglycan/xylan/chitin deacetylase (PgdA/CDA1 family)